MENKFIAQATIIILSPPEKVWQALTDPAMIKQYLFGTEAISDWTEGSPITYRGVWQGKSYEDKGKVMRVVPKKLLETTYWSGMSGLPDIPQNYKNVSYELMSVIGGTRLTITQDNNKSEEEKNHSENNWKMVLDGLKKLLEN